MNFWKLQVGDTLWSAKITDDIKFELLEWAIWEIREIGEFKFISLSPKTASGKFRELEFWSGDYKFPKVDKPKYLSAFAPSSEPHKIGSSYTAWFHWDKDKLFRSMAEKCKIKLKEIREEQDRLKTENLKYQDILFKLK